MTKVLVTGGAGFIALHLANRLLDGGYEVHLTDNFSRGVRDKELESTLERQGVSFSVTDCMDASSIDKLGFDFKYIFHMAAIIGVRHVEDRPANVVTDNLRMLENMLSHARKQKNMNRFLFASTSEVYAGTLENFELPIPTPESTPLALTDLSRPRTSYMLSKISGEALCHYSELPFTVFRPHNVYGPRMGVSHVIPEQLRKAYEGSVGSALPVPSVEQTRTFCYVEDAVEMLHRMMESPKCVGQTLNLGVQDPEITMHNLAEKCYEVVGKQQKVEPMPATVGSPSRRCPDMSITNSLLGFIPRVGLDEGIRRTYEWYVQNVFDGHGTSAQ